MDIIADISLVTKKNNKFIWFGKKYRLPTSEWQSHWKLYELCKDKRKVCIYVIHFHPVELLQGYSQAQKLGKDTSEILEEISTCLERRLIIKT